MKKTVLIIDDSFYMRSVLRKYLESAGYEVIGEAENGEKGIDMALELKPAVITLDIILPDMIGLDIIKVLKQEEGLASKIVLVSVVGQLAVIKRGLQLGADAYLIKPFNEEQLIEKLNTV